MLVESGPEHRSLADVHSLHPVYYLYLPTMLAWYGAYAIARSSDLKWGNCPDSTESSGEVIETARILVGLSVTTNLLIAAVSI